MKSTINCPKCGGFMYLECFSDFFLRFFSWKCANCGSLLDFTILENRRKHKFLRRPSSQA